MTEYIRRMTPNLLGRDFVIGDIHGCITEFFVLLQHVRFDFSIDRVFSVGDLIDRGEHSIEALELLYEKWFFPVLGNHDEMMRDYFTSDDEDLAAGSLMTWLQNGGNWILDEDVDQTVLKHYAQRLTKLPYVIHVDGEGPAKFNIVHGELIGTVPLSDVNLETANIDYSRATWGRSWADPFTNWSCMVDKVQSPDLSIVYCGHNTVPEIRQYMRQIDIDLGCAFRYVNPEIEDINELVLVQPAAGKAFCCSSVSLEVSEICLRSTINMLSNTDNKFVEATYIK